MARKQPAGNRLEDALARLEEIVARLEKGDAGLEESINLYREGRLLAKTCQDRLRELEQQVLLVKEEAESPPEAEE